MFDQKSLYYYHILMEAFRHKSFYVLGAGASKYIVPTTDELEPCITSHYPNLWGYPAELIYPDMLSSRLIKNRDFSDPTFNVPNDFNRWLTYHELSKHHDSQIDNCPPYDVFLFAKRNSIIFTTNLDGLATRCKSNHFVYEAHGRIPTFCGSKAFLEEGIEHYSLYDRSTFALDILLIGKETTRVLEKREYMSASINYMPCKFMLVIGYSFGMSNNKTLDDKITYEYIFKTLYPKNKIPVLVIAPDTYDLVHRIKDEINSNMVYGINTDWYVLSQIIISSLCNTNYNRRNLIRDFCYLEEKLHAKR